MNTMVREYNKSVFCVVFRSSTDTKTEYILAENVEELISVYKDGTLMLGESGVEATYLESITYLGRIRMIGELGKGKPVTNIRKL